MRHAIFTRVSAPDALSAHPHAASYLLCPPVRSFVFFVLTHFDLEKCDPGAELPPVNPGRYGLGVLQPDGDLQIRYRLKRGPPSNVT